MPLGTSSSLSEELLTVVYAVLACPSRSVSSALPCRDVAEGMLGLATSVRAVTNTVSFLASSLTKSVPQVSLTRLRTGDALVC